MHSSCSNRTSSISNFILGKLLPLRVTAILSDHNTNTQIDKPSPVSSHQIPYWSSVGGHTSIQAIEPQAICGKNLHISNSIDISALRGAGPCLLWWHSGWPGAAMTTWPAGCDALDAGFWAAGNVWARYHHTVTGHTGLHAATRSYHEKRPRDLDNITYTRHKVLRGNLKKYIKKNCDRTIYEYQQAII